MMGAQRLSSILLTLFLLPCSLLRIIHLCDGSSANLQECETPVTSLRGILKPQSRRNISTMKGRVMDALKRIACCAENHPEVVRTTPLMEASPPSGSPSPTDEWKERSVRFLMDFDEDHTEVVEYVDASLQRIDSEIHLGDKDNQGEASVARTQEVGTNHINPVEDDGEVIEKARGGTTIPVELFEEARAGAEFAKLASPQASPIPCAHAVGEVKIVEEMQRKMEA